MKQSSRYRRVSGHSRESMNMSLMTHSVIFPASIAASRNALFDNLIGTAEQWQREGKTQRLCSLEIDDEFHFCGLHHRQVGRLFPLEDACNVDTDLVIVVWQVCTIAHQAACHGKFAQAIAGRQRLVRRQCNQRLAPFQEQRIGANNERADALVAKSIEARLDIRLVCYVLNDERPTESVCCCF